MRKRIASDAAKICLALALVASLAAIEHQLLDVNSTTASLTLVLVILGIATWLGLAAGIAGTVAGVLLFNLLFLPPVGTLTIDDPQNVVAFLAFLITAVTASQLSGRAKRRAEEAIARRRDVERLYEFGRAMLFKDRFESLISGSLNDIVRIFEMDARYYDAETGAFQGTHGEPLSDAVMKSCAESETASINEKWIVVPVRLGGTTMGSLGLAGPDPMSGTLGEAIGNLLAVGLEHARAIERAGEAEAARRSEKLKSALLESLAHNLKTPLTAIKASVTSLISNHPKTQERRQELLTIVDEETDALHRIVSNALHMARIDAGKLALARERRSLSDILPEVLAEYKSASIQLEVPPDLPLVDVDPDLVKQVFTQLVDNALKYGHPSAEIGIKAAVVGGSVVVSVWDRGPGIPANERPYVFNRSYRGRDALNRVEGTGLGLAIAKEIIDAHGGKVWVDDNEGGGAILRFSLPEVKEQ